jgi:hypothetical protein
VWIAEIMGFFCVMEALNAGVRGTKNITQIPTDSNSESFSTINPQFLKKSNPNITLQLKHLAFQSTPPIKFSLLTK